MGVEEHRLRNGVRADELGFVGCLFAFGEILIRFARIALQFDLVELRACFEATTTAHALAKRIVLLLRFPGDARSSAHVVVPVDRHPRLDSLQRMEQPRTIDDQIANDGELRHWLQFDLFRIVFKQSINQRAAALSDSTVDHHGA